MGRSIEEEVAMRKLDRYTIDTRAPKLNQFVCDWLDGNGARVFNYEGDTFELRDCDSTYEVYVNGEFALSTKKTEEKIYRNVRNLGQQIYDLEIFRDIRKVGDNRTLYDYTALLRNEGASYGLCTNTSYLGQTRERISAGYSEEQLKDTRQAIRINVSSNDVHMGYHVAVYETVLMRMELGLSLADALNVTFAVCGDRATVDKMRNTLLCGEEESSEYDLRKIVTRNIVCHDPDTYDGSFNGTDLTDDELEAKNEFNLMW